MQPSSCRCHEPATPGHRCWATREAHLTAYQDAACAVLDEFHSGEMAAKSGVPGQTLRSKAMRKLWVAYKEHCMSGPAPSALPAGEELDEFREGASKSREAIDALDAEQAADAACMAGDVRFVRTPPPTPPAASEGQVGREARCDSRFLLIESPEEFNGSCRMREVRCIQYGEHASHTDGLGHVWTDTEQVGGREAGRGRTDDGEVEIAMVPAAAREGGVMRLNAYYYGFDATGVEAIDNVLSAVACAGKAYHLTEDWTEKIGSPYESTHRGASPVEWIQNAAIDAAKEVDTLRRDVERLAAENARLESQLDRQECLYLDAAKERDAARAQVERLRGALDGIARTASAHDDHGIEYIARAALADAAGEEPSK